MRKCISSHERLTATLRFLAIGRREIKREIPGKKSPNYNITHNHAKTIFILNYI